MTEMAILFDSSKCTGCKGCQVACKCWINLPSYLKGANAEEDFTGTYQNPPDLNGTTRLIMTFAERDGAGQKPVEWAFGRRSCMHCEDAPCQAVCPTGATYTNEAGIVCIDHGRCIGCKYCMAACPYQARVVDERTGAVDKCRFCTVSALNGTELSTCVTACPAGVRVFGDLDDPDSEVSKVLAATHATPLLGDATKSKIFYVR